MSKSLNAPTSRLLQSSRLFSLPRPLPQPPLEQATSTGIYRASESATLPYPTHQTIATPASSHFRGDWGLKRPLPSKATRHTSTPHIRVRQQDNAAHITDFGSAADHSRTVAKWEQMGIPLIANEPKSTFTNSRKTTQSVYDDELDSTDPDLKFIDSQMTEGSRSSPEIGQPPKQVKRWKYDGPWLPGMQEGEFEIWMMSKIAKRKGEFRRFLQDRMYKRKLQEEQKYLRDMGEAKQVSELRKVQIRKDIQENFSVEQKRMRDDHASQHLSSELTAAICDFLDLPGVQGSAQDLSGVARSEQFRGSLASLVPAATGPPSTHPGAGLSHIRSHAFIENHPLWGPQAHRSPVLARVVRPRNNPQGTEHQAKLGVGGIVTNDPVGASFIDRSKPLPDDDNIRQVYKETERMVSSLEPDLAGGNKTWVHPETASIDEQGRIRLNIARGDKEAIDVVENNVEHIHRARRSSMNDPYVPPAGTAGNANYGFGLPDMRRAGPTAPRSFARGFDAELGTQSGGQMSDKDAMTRLARIRELSSMQGRPPS